MFENFWLQASDIVEAALLPVVVDLILTPEEYLLAEADLYFPEINMQDYRIRLVVVQLLALANKELRASHEQDRVFELAVFYEIFWREEFVHEFAHV
jgi:hypothetical protein